MNTSPSATPIVPRVVVLGTAQDGGIPQAGCRCGACAAAREDGARVRRPASLGVVTPAVSEDAHDGAGEGAELVLVDATPALVAQIDLLQAEARRAGDARDRPRRRPVDRLVLTHAHMGHIGGLLQFGPEAIAPEALAVHVRPRLAELLRTQAPWRLLVEAGHLRCAPLAAGAGVEPLRLGGGVAIETFEVPHRGEFSETVGLRIRGPRRQVVYIPDIDAWDDMVPSLEELLRSLDAAAGDVAYLDGTFASRDELGDRDPDEVLHPLVADTLERVAGLGTAGRGLVRFLHLNHTNPLVSDGPEREPVVSAGCAVAEEGEVVDL